MEPDAMAQNLWSLANVVTGFSVAQSLATAYEFDKALAALRAARRSAKIVFVVVRLFFASLAAAAVWYLAILAAALDSAHINIWEAVTAGRVICIYLFAGLSVFALFAPRVVNGRVSQGAQPTVQADGPASRGPAA